MLSKNFHPPIPRRQGDFQPSLEGAQCQTTSDSFPFLPTYSVSFLSRPLIENLSYTSWNPAPTRFNSKVSVLSVERI